MKDEAGNQLTKDNLKIAKRHGLQWFIQVQTKGLTKEGR